MNTYVITYDLSGQTFSPQTRYNEIEKTIKSMGPWAKVATTTFLVNSGKGPVELRTALAPYFTPNDKLFICVATKPAAWAGMSDPVRDWLLGTMI